MEHKMTTTTTTTTVGGAERKGLPESPSSSSISSSGTLSTSSLESELDSFEEVTSSSSPSSSSTTDHPLPLPADPLLDVSSLFQQLPIKRGLSKHYQGKSQSFTSLANVRSLEDLPKPENPYNKKLKSCRRSYGGRLMGETNSSRGNMSQQISKNSSVSCSSISVKRASSNMGISIRPPMPPPHQSTSTTAITNQTPLFA